MLVDIKRFEIPIYIYTEQEIIQDSFCVHIAVSFVLVLHHHHRPYRCDQGGTEDDGEGNDEILDV